jgi:mRNA interferase MazF
LRRGEVWTAAGGPDYAGKPRPVVIIQDDRFDATESITVCALTTTQIDAPVFRIPIDPNPMNGLRSLSNVMVDKITSMPKHKLRRQLGKLNDSDLFRLNRAIATFLGLGSA